METRARLFGHPIHQMLIPIPFGLIATGVVLDIISRFVRVDVLTVVSFWNLAIGIGMGLIAAIFGIIDWTGLPKHTRARRVGVFHATANVTVIVLLAIALSQRAGERFFRLTDIAFVLELVALAVVLIAGWLGGELVDRMGIGVAPEAHPNAPSALRKRAMRRNGEEKRTTLPYGSPSEA
jgi:uncharacterized membrane protein